MKTYEVTVEAVIRKTYSVKADDWEEATLQAYDMFTVEPDGDEYYDQQVIDISED
jgi:hypothetical protein